MQETLVGQHWVFMQCGERHRAAAAAAEKGGGGGAAECNVYSI